MDSLTQIVLGASVGEAILGRKVGNKAILYGAIAGTIPDLDVLSGFFLDTVTGIEWHRGFSHSIVFAVVFAPVFGWLVSKIERKSSTTWQDWSWLMFWGFITHALLDTFTTWGTQLFWPFSHRVAFQNVFVIDPLYTIPFLIFLIMAMRQKKTSPKRGKYNRLGLIVSSSYLVLALILKGISYQIFTESLAAQNISYQALDTRPTPFNSILWAANVDAGDVYLLGEYSFFDSKEIQFTSYPKNHELLGDLAENDQVKRLIKISEGWYTITHNDGQLLFNDLRFGLISLKPKETDFTFSYILDQSGPELEIRERPRPKIDPKSVLGSLWKRIWGN